MQVYHTKVRFQSLGSIFMFLYNSISTHSIFYFAFVFHKKGEEEHEEKSRWKKSTTALFCEKAQVEIFIIQITDNEMVVIGNILV